MKGPISLQVRSDDILNVAADILAVQYPQRLFGSIERVINAFAQAERSVLLPPPGTVRVLDGVGGIAATKVLIIGVPALQEYGYRDIREFGTRAVLSMASVPAARHVALPVYGPGYGFDEIESFESEVAGVVDAIRGNMVSEALSTIILVERDEGRASRLKELLSKILLGRVVEGPGSDAQDPGESSAQIGSRPPGASRIASTLAEQEGL